MQKLALFALCLFLTSCQKYYLTIYQEKVDRSSLASTYVGTPDPRQKKPPRGEEIIIEWQIPRDLLEENPSIHLEIIYKDFSESSFVYPLSFKGGYIVNALLGEEFEKKKGFLSYRAELQKEDGSVFLSWQHQLWVRPIHLEEIQEEESSKDQSFSSEETEEEQSATFFPPEA